jgi:hypothetical protein
MCDLHMLQGRSSNHLHSYLKLGVHTLINLECGKKRFLIFWLGPNTFKGANEITSCKRNASLFFSFFHFFIWNLFLWNLLQLIIKHGYSCPNISYTICFVLVIVEYIWVFFKCVDFVKFCVSCWKNIIIFNYTKLC